MCVEKTHISNHPTKKSSYKKHKFLNPTSYPVATKVRRGNRFFFVQKQNSEVPNPERSIKQHKHDTRTLWRVEG